MIQLTDISLRFGERELYTSLNWQVPDGARVALVGNNGVGKTTLFRVIIGQMEPDSGIVSVPKRSTIAYLTQELSETLDNNISISQLFETQKSYEIAARAGRVLKGLGFAVADLERKVGEFSGGWKMRLQLARILASDASVLLLDEPTNHLDTESMEWLEGWLSGSFRGTLVAISHDRRFLDKLCPVTAELSRGVITVWKGNYTYYEEESRKRRELLLQQKREQAAQIEKTREFIERFRYKATKATQVQSRVKALEKINVIEVDDDLPTAHFKFPECEQSGYEVVKLDGVSKVYGEHTVFSGVSFSLNRGQKVALVGANGAGKSTMARLISGFEPPTSGTVKQGYGVKCTFFLQESVQNLEYSLTIWDEISRTGKIDAVHKRDLLGAFLFKDDDIYKRISTLSGGEKSRLALLKVLLRDSNFLVLDEPTNHLDMATREVFQRALLDYSGTLLLVSHDRHFLDSLAERVVEIRDGRVYDYPGNYSYFIEKRERMLAAAAGEGEGVAVRADDSPSRRRNMERAEFIRLRAAARREVANAEDKIHRLEGDMAECDRSLCLPEVLADSDKVQSLMRRRASAAGELDEMMSLWEQKMEELSKFEE